MITDEDVKAAEERYIRELTAKNTALQKKLCEMNALMLERDAAASAEIEVRHGTVVFL